MLQTYLTTVWPSCGQASSGQANQQGCPLPAPGGQLLPAKQEACRNKPLIHTHQAPALGEYLRKMRACLTHTPPQLFFNINFAFVKDSFVCVTHDAFFFSNSNPKNPANLHIFSWSAYTASYFTQIIFKKCLVSF